MLPKNFYAVFPALLSGKSKYQDTHPRCDHVSTHLIMDVWLRKSLWTGIDFAAVHSGKWCEIAGTSMLHNSQLGSRAQASVSSQIVRTGHQCFAGAQGGVFLGCFLIPKVSRCALKQLRFLSFSHGPTSLRIGNGVGLQTMSWILPSLKSLAEIPGTGYEHCSSGGASDKQGALSSIDQFNWTAWTGKTLQGTQVRLARQTCWLLRWLVPWGLLRACC